MIFNLRKLKSKLILELNSAITGELRIGHSFKSDLFMILKSDVMPQHGKRLETEDLSDDILLEVEGSGDVDKKLEDLGTLLAIWNVTLGDGDKRFTLKDLEREYNENLFIQLPLELCVRNGELERTYENGEALYKLSDKGLEVTKEIIRNA